MLRNLFPTPLRAFSIPQQRMGFFLMYGKSQVLPLFKIQDLSQTLISVISVFASMLERLAHDQLSEFLKVSNILTSSQAVFRKLYSRTTSPISRTDYWQENMDKNKVNLTIFLDLRKAFDAEDHDTIIKKINSRVQKK